MGRNMKRPPSEYGLALKIKIAERKWKQREAARVLGCSESALSRWLNCEVIPDKKYQDRIRKEFNLILEPEELLNDNEAIEINQVTKQLAMTFTESDDADDDFEDEEREVKANGQAYNWIYMYSTNAYDTYRSAVISRDDLPEKFKLILVRQRIKGKRRTIPFVIKAFPADMPTFAEFEKHIEEALNA